MSIRRFCVTFIFLYLVRGNVASADVVAVIPKEYNATYPITPPMIARPGVVTYRIAMIADLDSDARVANDEKCSISWHSFLKKGYLTYSMSNDKLEFKWDEEKPQELSSGFAIGGRGMELSELVTFDGKLFSFDDRTGLVYDVTNMTDKPIPWVILIDGNGHSSKGFKAEWGTIKDKQLYVGSTGTEFLKKNGEVDNEDALFVKVISSEGVVKSLDWSDNFKKIRLMADQIAWPGYMKHESGVWSDIHKKWFFLPRRCSHEAFDPARDEYMGCNLLISSDETFENIHAVMIDKDAMEHQPTHGFSSFKFVPGTEDRIIVAIKTEELQGTTATFLTAFDLKGKTVYGPEHIDADLKYEGIEFI